MYPVFFMTVFLIVTSAFIGVVMPDPISALIVAFIWGWAVTYFTMKNIIYLTQ